MDIQDALKKWAADGRKYAQIKEIERDFKCSIFASSPAAYSACDARSARARAAEKWQIEVRAKKGRGYSKTAEYYYI